MKNIATASIEIKRLTVSYILGSQRDVDCARAFRRYEEYLDQNKQRFPKSSFALATSDWYFNPQDHRSPHDAWLESLTIVELSRGERNEQRATSIKVRLLGAYHDGHIQLNYPAVFAYSFKAPSSERGLGDWRFDEFRITPNGRVIHEIEWAGFGGGSATQWIIEASDVEFLWIQKNAG